MANGDENSFFWIVIGFSVEVQDSVQLKMKIFSSGAFKNATKKTLEGISKQKAQAAMQT